MKLYEINISNNIFGIIHVFYRPGKVFAVCPYTRVRGKDNEYVYLPAKLNWSNGVPLISELNLFNLKSIKSYEIILGVWFTR